MVWFNVCSLGSNWLTLQVSIASGNRPVSQIPECIRQVSHNAPFGNRHMCTFLLLNIALWDMGLLHCGIYVIGLLVRTGNKPLPESMLIQFTDPYMHHPYSMSYAERFRVWEHVFQAMSCGCFSLVVSTVALGDFKSPNVFCDYKTWLLFCYMETDISIQFRNNTKLSCFLYLLVICRQLVGERLLRITLQTRQTRGVTEHKHLLLTWNNLNPNME